MERGGPVVPVYIYEAPSAGGVGSGAASRWWLHHSLNALDDSLRAHASQLSLFAGDPVARLLELVQTAGARAVYWNRCYEPAGRARDAAAESALVAAGIEVRTFNGALLNEPPAVLNQEGRPFQVFTPYWRRCLALPVLAATRFSVSPMTAPRSWPRAQKSTTLALLDEHAAAAPWLALGEPGEKGAAKRLRDFVAQSMEAYDEQRDRPDLAGTSRLSAALHFGEVSPRQVWAAVKKSSRESGIFPPNNGARVFLGEIGWREFAQYSVFHFPHTVDQPFRLAFADFDWAADPEDRKLKAWQSGQTGYPFVDAGMRQLSQSGWMHNRVRMVVASFLVKHLRLPWQHGAAWFAQTLADADVANNTLGWQWSAGCGADAAPYFRIFAPVLQGNKFDPRGDYVRRWVPELARLPARAIHAPWLAEPEQLAVAGVRLGENYSPPIVDHVTARHEALAAFKALRRSR